MTQSWTGILYMGTGSTGSTGSTGPTGQTGPTGLQGAFFSTLSVVDTANGTTLLTPTSFYLGAGGAITDFSGIGSQEGLSLQTNGIYLQIGNAPLISNGTTINIGLRDKNAQYWLYAECLGGASTTSVQIRMNINNGQGNVAQGSPFTYTSNQILTFSLDGVNASFLLDGVVKLSIPYTTTQAPNPLGFFANGGATAVTYSQVLFYPIGPKGVTGPTGPTGPVASDALAWTTYTPTWAADTGSVSIGNGTLTGSYKQIGKTVFFTARIQLGTTSSVSGSGGWQVGLPFTSVAAPSIIANATYLRNGVAYYGGIANNEYGNSTTFVSPLCLVSPVTGVLTQVTETTPFTWTTNDSLLITGTYQTV